MAGRAALTLLAVALFWGGPPQSFGRDAVGSRGSGSVLGSALVGQAAGQGESPDSALDATVSRIASQLRCPVCEALSIEDSPTELAREMKGVIRDQLAAGRTPGEVKAYFVDTYGEWVLLQPEASGFNLLVYVLPLLAILGGAGLVFV